MVAVIATAILDLLLHHSRYRDLRRQLSAAREASGRIAESTVSRTETAHILAAASTARRATGAMTASLLPVNPGYTGHGPLKPNRSGRGAIPNSPCGHPSGQ